MKTFKPFLFLLTLTLGCSWAARAQAPLITSFERNGTLVASNLAPGTTANIEWAADVEGPWFTNWAHLESVLVDTSRTISVRVPRFYRVRGIPYVAPTVTTTNATSVTSSGATLQGGANPNGSATTAWFRYSTANPGTPNNSFGTRVPSSSFNDAALGAGTAPVGFSQAISGLIPGTTYYFCAIAQNAQGISFGPIFSFTTAANAPTVTTGSATSRTGTSVILNGSANPGGDSTTAWFRYSTASPGVVNDTFGMRAPASGGLALGGGMSSTPFSQAISGLTPGTTYYYAAIASNSVGRTFGSLLTFTTPLPPTASTVSASSISGTSATLNGSGNPNGSSSSGWFRYSTVNPGTANDVAGTRAPANGGSALGSGTSPQAYAQAISGLSPGTTYYFWAIVSSAEGTNFGSILSFTTPGSPTVTSSNATSVTSSAATLNGAANPNGAAATGWFRYSIANPGTPNDSFGTRAPSSSFSDAALGAGTSPVSFSRGISGLLPNTTYYFCAISQNAEGTSFGPVLSFTTPPSAPSVSTGSATGRTGTGATLNGSANPGGNATTAWFRFALASPGTANDTFGTRAPASGGLALGAGTSSTSFAQAISGLTPGTTYYYAAIASNSVGITFGNVLTFTTPLPPTANTVNASSVTSTSASLNGSGNPNGSSSTGWFRYSTFHPGSANDVAGTRVPATGGSNLGSGTSVQIFSQAINGLNPGTTYYFWAIVSSAEGTSFGQVLSFTTP